MIIYLNTLLITFIIMYVIDKSGIILDISKLFYKVLNKKEWNGQLISLKPFTCSSCMIFHTLWVYLILFNNFNIILGLFISIISSTYVNILFNKLYDIIFGIIYKIK